MPFSQGYEMEHRVESWAIKLRLESIRRSDWWGSLGDDALHYRVRYSQR